ncbi:MAG: hypothetical protein EOP64_04835 [Sphingomonas sp.]|nr:MAG: hypothetical protein EOP64_04835 [Sphingomonas sp.]
MVFVTSTANGQNEGETVPSAFLSAISATFRLGEKFFIDSARRFSGKVHGRLAEDIRRLVIHEAFYTREHLAFNKMVGDTEYSTTAMTERIECLVKSSLPKVSPSKQNSLMTAQAACVRSNLVEPTAISNGETGLDMR